jgi:hypothetical protein
MLTKTRAAAIAACITLMTSACAANATQKAIVIGDGDESVPSATLVDWKSYGDAIGVFVVNAEHALPEASNVMSSGEGLIARTVDVRLTDVVWRRTGGPDIPSKFALSAFGWTVHGGSRRPTVARGEPRLEKGHVYFGAIARFADGGWSVLGSGAAVPYDGGQLGKGEWRGRVDASLGPAISHLIGKSVGAVRAAIAAALPDPLAIKYASLDPATRYQKVLGN